ncbi:hypothetical protein H5410_014239 [Solanum commersonii]|uniref:Protein-lysine N-methyltransferase n=1 Tax=Solanum commersonii TaxID=4109 RepID=A0A9J5ZQU8_SOLCO|nr:hypothetical protein H5410_014239 [Solanum commersonii]
MVKLLPCDQEVTGSSLGIAAGRNARKGCIQWVLPQTLRIMGSFSAPGCPLCNLDIPIKYCVHDRTLFKSIVAIEWDTVLNVDDILETKLDTTFRLVLDKGTLDAIGLHPDGPIKRIMYWDAVSRIVAPGGLLVITSCNSTKDELVEEVETLNQRKNAVGNQEASSDPPPFRYLDHVRTYPTFTFGGSVGSRVATVAFMRN